MGLAEPGSQQAGAALAAFKASRLLGPAGVATTAYNTSQQWDYPNAWPPLQDILIEAFAATGTGFTPYSLLHVSFGFCACMPLLSGLLFGNARACQSLEARYSVVTQCAALPAGTTQPPFRTIMCAVSALLWLHCASKGTAASFQDPQRIAIANRSTCCQTSFEYTAAQARTADSWRRLWRSAAC